MKVTGTRQHRAWAARRLPPVERVRPGLWSVPVPIPHSPLRYTLVYLIETGRGAALVDAGWPADDSWQSLLDGVGRTGHAIGDVHTVLVTHGHLDHLGLAARVREHSGAAIAMHPAEARQLDPVRAADAGGGGVRRWLRARGVPEPEGAALTERLAWWRTAFRDLARPDRLVSDGDRPLGPDAGIRAVWTPGHTPGHLCFVDEQRDVLLTGDHMLPRITPNISLPPGDAGDPLGDYLNSLSMVDMDRYASAEVLPAHEYRFTGLVARRDALLAHHRARLAEAEELVRRSPGATTWAVAARLHWSRPWEQFDGMMRQSALGEAYSHLVHLQARHRIANIGTGVDTWQPVDTRQPPAPLAGPARVLPARRRRPDSPSAPPGSSELPDSPSHTPASPSGPPGSSDLSGPSDSSDSSASVPEAGPGPVSGSRPSLR